MAWGQTEQFVFKGALYPGDVAVFKSILCQKSLLSIFTRTKNAELRKCYQMKFNRASKQ